MFGKHLPVVAIELRHSPIRVFVGDESPQSCEQLRVVKALGCQSQGKLVASAICTLGNYFPVLGVGPALGQVLTNDDDRRPNANPVAVISYDSWKTAEASTWSRDTHRVDLCAHRGGPVSIPPKPRCRRLTSDCAPGGENPATAGRNYGLRRKEMRTCENCWCSARIRGSRASRQ
jgi:hypothetical protein